MSDSTPSPAGATGRGDGPTNCSTNGSTSASTAPAGVGRRRLFAYLGSAAAGAAVGAAVGATARGTGADAGAGAAGAPARPGATISPWGTHQPGIAQPTPASVEVLSFTLTERAAQDPEALPRLLRVWSTDIEALTQGRGSPGDTTSGLAQKNGDLTITVGLGGRALSRLPTPAGWKPTPAFAHDKLQERWNGGDLVVLVAGRDATTTAHAVRRLVLDAGPWTTVRWRQVGSWNGVAADGTRQTGRNHFGQVDGSANPTPGTPVFDETVWITEGPWAGGTTLAVRRIVMDLVEWDTLTPSEQEASVGRSLSTGAPLSGGDEFSDFDFDSTDASGKQRIAIRAHGRRSHPSLNGGARLFRKGLNYVAGESTTGEPLALETGLVFLSFQKDFDAQFLRIQKSLDVADELNEWTTAIGSAQFCILPGFAQGEWLGQQLFQA